MSMRFGTMLAAGILAISFLTTHLHAQGVPPAATPTAAAVVPAAPPPAAAPAAPASTLSAGDTAWVLAASALVLLMTPGLAFFYLPG